jgi:hypothetical protein
MPKIGPNKVSIDPKAYAARVTRAKKTVASMDPATAKKIKDMYPKITKEAIVNKALSPKKATAKKAAAKPIAKPKVTTKPKPKGLNDYLDKGQTPPSRNKKLPSDADVILKGYNDKKTIAKLKARKNK